MVDVIDMTARSVDPTGASGPSVSFHGNLSRSQIGWYRGFGKRALDILLVCASSIVVVPLLAILSALVALDGGSPFYHQIRIGQDGQKFRLLKLRTMIPNAEEALTQILRENAELAREWERTQKLRCDPRVTRVGRFLRASSLDELPQFWNVLRGDMSLVGPRPMMPDQRELYVGAIYSDLRPGVTGLWQVSARNAESFTRRAEYDREYDDRLGLITDLRLMLRTITVVFRGTGC